MVDNVAIDRITADRVVPVVVPTKAENMILLADALLAGGLGTIEVTLRTDGALDALASLTKDGRMIVGAGTVLTIEQAEAAVEAGAQFLVSPGFDPELVDWAKEKAIPFIPGVMTASEAIRARAAGLDLVKFFPAEAAGGIATIKGLASVFPSLGFMPTGGITADLLPDYLALDAVRAVGGTWIAPAKDIEAERFDDIAARTLEARKVAKDSR